MTAHAVLAADRIDIAYEAHGPEAGRAVVLLHGFPYAPRAFDAVAPALAAAGLRVIVPYLRGFGPTRLAEGVMRSGQQAALGDDLRRLIEGLGLERPILCGFDWGGRAACVAAALWPERIGGLVAIGGSLIQHLADPTRPAPPAVEQYAWHQYYLSSARGRRALLQQREALCRHFWRQWSPNWDFDDAIFAASAAAFDNPDFVDVAVHSYAHRIGAAEGDPLYAGLEMALTRASAIDVPAILLFGGDSALANRREEAFPQLMRSEIVDGAGHNPPAERPQAVIDAILELARLG